MTDVVTWLRAALDAIEQVAREAVAGLGVHGRGVSDPERAGWAPAGPS